MQPFLPPSLGDWLWAGHAFMILTAASVWLDYSARGPHAAKDRRLQALLATAVLLVGYTPGVLFDAGLFGSSAPQRKWAYFCGFLVVLSSTRTLGAVWLGRWLFKGRLERIAERAARSHPVRTPDAQR